jgi:hypothetical protein
VTKATWTLEPQKYRLSILPLWCYRNTNCTFIVLHEKRHHLSLMDLYLYSIEFWKWQELSDPIVPIRKASLRYIRSPNSSPTHHHPFCSALIFPHVLNKPRFLYDRDSSMCHIQNILPNVFKWQDHSLLIYVNFRKWDSMRRGSDGAQLQIYSQRKMWRQ